MLKKGISQRKLSRQTGIDNNTIAKIENVSRKKSNALSLNELLDKPDFLVLDSFRSKSKGEQKIILEELRKYKDNNNQEIKGLEEHIKNLEEMFNKD